MRLRQAKAGAGITMAVQRQAGGAAGVGKQTMHEREARLAAASEERGSPVAPAIRANVERATGASLGRVQVHTGQASHEAARSIDAHAYCIGQDIHFGEGHYRPGTPDGDRLIAHELVRTSPDRDRDLHGPWWELP